MYQHTDLPPQFPTFSKETVEAIQAAFNGKVEGLWEAEQTVIQAVLKDINLDPLAKATEIQRAMTRFLTTSSNYNVATQPTALYGGFGGMNPYGVNYPGPYGRDFMPGHNGNPLAGNSTNTNVAHQHGFELKTDKEGLSATKVNLVFNLNKVGVLNNGCDGIDVYINDQPSPSISLHGVFDNNEDRNAVGIVAIAEPNTYFEDEEMKIGVFLGLMGALGLDSNLFGFTTRMMPHPGINTHETKVLYIDLAAGDDPMEAENFSDAIKGNFGTFVEYKNLFPASE